MTYWVVVELTSSVLRLKVQAETPEEAIQLVKETKLVEVADRFEISETHFTPEYRRKYD